MEDDAGALVRRPALKTGFSEMGWGSTPLSSAKFRFQSVHGRILACHARGRGSLPLETANIKAAIPVAAFIFVGGQYEKITNKCYICCK